MRMVAYDFETTRIAVGTPRPLYLTAYGENPAFHYDGPLRSIEHLRDILISRFLDPDLVGVNYVAWNANNFDSYFVAAALLHGDEYVLRPFMTRSKALRGLRVIHRDDVELHHDKQRAWQFLDGMAMLGLPGLSLEKLLKNFAPDFQKIVGAIDWEREEFDPKNQDHQFYAMRDSEGLYHAMHRAQAIMLDTFNQPLQVTLGAACVKIFCSQIPEKVVIPHLPDEVLDTVRQYVMRGGFCFCVDRYEGPVWKYDLNQAYAAAMREARLPAGRTLWTPGGVNRYAKIYIARVTATNPENRIPFYYRTLVDDRLRSVYATDEISSTWLTSIEVDQLRLEGWKVKIHESHAFDSHFNMRDYVDKLERIRTTAEGGPSGPIGTMMKAIGNSSYGKTVEVLDGVEYLLAASQPDGYEPYYEGFEAIENVWFRYGEMKVKPYHQPHLGAFITAHVRMVVRRAALLNPGAWLYADTDCVMYSEPMGHLLDIDQRRYGAWKVEEENKHHLIIAKKVYFNQASGKGSAKGMNVKRLSATDFRAWYDGEVPEQHQVQRRNFSDVMAGAEMYRAQTRRGTGAGKRENKVA